MSGFLGFLALVAVFIGVARYLRKREMEAFKGEDLSALKNFIPTKKKPDSEPTVPLVDVDELRARYPDLATRTASVEQQGPHYTLKDVVLDEIHRNVLEILHGILPAHHRILVNLPLTAIVKGESSEVLLAGTSLSFVACDARDYSVVFAVLLRGAGTSEVSKAELVARVFSDIGKPLVVLPLVSGISESEVKSQLVGVIET